MRLFVSLMTVVLLILVLGFVSTNYDARVGVTFLKTLHEDVPLYAVVLLAIVVGIVYTGGIQRKRKSGGMGLDRGASGCASELPPVIRRVPRLSLYRGNS